MICPTCGANNRDGAAFCHHCGRLLHNACPRCRAAAEPDANFCDTCGCPLSPAAWTGITNHESRITTPVVLRNEEGSTAPPAISPSPNLSLTSNPPLPTSPATPQLDRFIPRELLDKLTATRGSAAERRVVTLLFCDIVGSTALAGSLDPEEWTEIVNGAFEQMVRPIYKYEGTVARLMGDGLLAFFGAPIAHEDDPRRAVLAGLAIIEGIHAYRRSLPPDGSELDVRVGINTGLVVVGAVGSDLRLEYSAIGDAINLAARMEQTAAPGTVQIAEDTHRLIEGQFEVEALGDIAVKGKAQPVPAFRVLRRAESDSRRPVSLRSGLVNRRMEWRQLETGFDALNAGRGGIHFLTGDAGLGKTRLIDEAAERLAPLLNPPARCYEASAVSYETNQPFGLLLRLLRRPLGLLSGDPPERVRERIAAVVGSESEHAEDVHVLETLFGVASSAAGHEVAGEAFAHRLDQCLGRFWRAQARVGPVVLVLDELQWLDASSAERIARLFHLVESEAVLFLCALRRERRTPGWGLKESAGRDLPHRLTEAALYPLNDGESRALLAGLLDPAEIPQSLAALILEKAEGNPLYLEEVVRHLIERGHLSRAGDGSWAVAPTGAPVEEIALPDSIQALLTARIDRLDDATRRTLQVASVIGRHFMRSPLAALIDEPDALDRQLLDLQRVGLVREVSRVPEPGYVFDHTLTQEAVYHTILMRQRRAMHLRAAEVIERLRADNLPAVAPVLAHHFIEGDAPERALPWLLSAAGSALRLHATAEAINHYERALPIALTLAEGTERLIEIYTSHGRALELQSRFAEAKQSYEEMERLARERDEPALELEAVIALGKLYANVTPFYDAAHGRALMERAMALAEATDNRAAETRILWNLVNIDRFDTNSLDRAIANGERGVALARELGLREELAYLLNDLGDLSATAGDIPRAKVLLAEAGELWRELGNEPMLADSLTSTAIWNHITGETAPSLAHADEAFAITSRLDNIWGMAYSQATRGQILGWRGEIGRAVADLTEANKNTHLAGFIGGQVLSNCFLSRILYEVGAFDEAIKTGLLGLEIGREQLPQFAAIGIGRAVFGLLARGDVTAAAELFADPLTRQETQQIFLTYDIALAEVELALAQGQTDAAVEHAAAAINRFTDLGAGLWLGDGYHAQAKALIAAERLDDAAASLRQAIEQARRLEVRGSLWRYLGAAMALEEARGNPDAAAALRAEAAAEVAFVAGNTWPDDLRASFLSQPEVVRINHLTTD